MSERSDGSRTRSDLSQDGPKQRKPLERATTVAKDAGGRNLSEDSRRSTRDRTGVDRSNGPPVTREKNVDAKMPTPVELTRARQISR
eukprot:2173778-Pyramimonas_sp.AAC.2